jgi:hypothetical protein
MDFLSSPVLAYCWFGIYVFLAPAIFLLLCLRTDYAIMRRQLQLQVVSVTLFMVLNFCNDSCITFERDAPSLALDNIYQSYGILLPCPRIIPKMIFGRLLSFTAFYCSFLFCSHCFR